MKMKMYKPAWFRLTKLNYALINTNTPQIILILCVCVGGGLLGFVHYLLEILKK